jgi:hypothetical protein
MNPLRQKLVESAALPQFSVKDARVLLGLDWRSLTQPLPREVRQEADVLYHFVSGFVEEVDEGFVEGRDDPQIRDRIAKLLSLWPEG